MQKHAIENWLGWGWGETFANFLKSWRDQMSCFCVTYDYYAACPTLWFVSVHVPGSGVTWPGTRSRCPSLGWRSNCSNVERHPTLLLREDDDISAHLLKYSIHTAKTNLNKNVNSQLIKLPPINLLSITLQLSILKIFEVTGNYILGPICSAALRYTKV